jgi:antitoxin component YwqK of YwqJK toxin-antitoxin module
MELLPADLWRFVLEFDPTYRERFSRDVIPAIQKTVWLYHPNGRLFCRFRTDGAGKKEGRYVETYPTGRLRRIAWYHKGLLDGVSRDYHPDGTLFRFSVFRKGEIRGNVLDFFPGANGACSRFFSYDDASHPHGLCLDFYPDGTPMKRRTYRHGILRGVYRLYTGEGEVLSSFYF